MEAARDVLAAQALGEDPGDGTAATVSRPQLLTIGYQGRSLDEFVGRLRLYEIRRVIDVREIAWSRKKGFSATQLRDALAAVSIEYCHLPKLGSPRDVRKTLRADGDLPVFFKAYREYLDGQSQAVIDAAELATERRSALLCFELEPAECHRSALAALMQRRFGFVVRHL